jgi:hypothetical protein
MRRVRPRRTYLYVVSGLEPHLLVRGVRLEPQPVSRFARLGLRLSLGLISNSARDESKPRDGSSTHADARVDESIECKKVGWSPGAKVLLGVGVSVGALMLGTLIAYVALDND